MEVNVSDYTTGRVLFMECEDEKQRPVEYLSKLLNKTVRNYEIYDKEMLVVIRGLENQRIKKLEIFIRGYKIQV